MRLKEILAPTAGFQRSVSVLYDLDDYERIRGFIPTAQSEWVLKDVLTALANEGSRASMLIGSYGTGKSHLVTFIGGLLGKLVAADDFQTALPKIQDADLRDALLRETHETRPFLVIPVMGGADDVETLLLRALRRALSREQIRVPVDSAFSKAADVIARWRYEYAATYSEFASALETTAFQSVESFVEALSNADSDALMCFDDLHRKLSGGADFDPYGSDIIETYASVARALPRLGYRGIFLIFDEFNKILEQNSGDMATLKTLQDLSELCNRSDESMNLYLMVVSHKTIGQYVRISDQDSSEEWLKVEGRFRVYDLTRHPSERYQLMSRVLAKSCEDWREVLRAAGATLIGADRPELRELFGHRLPGFSLDAIDNLVHDCFPLHPVLVYSLPLVSNRLAQNERTMFTFMASCDDSPLSPILERDISETSYVYPFELFDYFGGEMRRSSETDIRTTWMKVGNALQQFSAGQVESKILRTIGVLSIIGSPLITTKGMVQFSLYPEISSEQFDEALIRLIGQRLVFWGDTGSLSISVPIGIDITAETAARTSRMTLDPIFDLLKYGIKDYIVPRKFNHRHKMTRYLSPMYVDYRGLTMILQKYSSGLKPGLDGIVVYVFPGTDQELAECRKCVSGSMNQQILVALPTEPLNVREAILKVRALEDIRSSVRKVRIDEEVESVLGMYYQDALSYLRTLVWRVTVPSPRVEYYWNGEKRGPIDSTNGLSDLVTNMMDSVFWHTPIMNNELVNRASPTSTSRRALNLVIDDVINGKAASGTKMRSSQEQFMFDTLFELTGLCPSTENSRSESCSLILGEVESYLGGSRDRPTGLSRLVSTLMEPPYGVRMGVLPVFLSVALSGQAKSIVFRDRSGTECLLNSALLEKIIADPDGYSVEVERWHDDFDLLVFGLASIFEVDLSVANSQAQAFEILGDSIFRWFAALPKYARETKQVDNVAQGLRQSARLVVRNPRSVILHEIPKASGYLGLDGNNVQAVLTAMRIAKADLESVLTVERGVVARLMENLFRDYGLKKGSLLEMARELISSHSDQLGVSPEVARFADYVQNHPKSEGEFMEGITKELTGVELADWSDETEDSFRSSLIGILDMACGAEKSPSMPQIEITIPDSASEPAKRYLIPRAPISETAGLLESQLESSIYDFGDAVSPTEVKQVLLNILKRMFES